MVATILITHLSLYKVDQDSVDRKKQSHKPVATREKVIEC